MGLVVKLSFDEGDRLVEIDNYNNIRFLDFEIDYDLAMVEFGEEPTEEAILHREYQEKGLDAIIFSDNRHFQKFYCEDWTEAFVNAIQEQGAEEFASGLTNEAVAKMLYSHLMKEERDFMQLALRLAGEKPVIRWLIEDLKRLIDTDRDYQLDSYAWELGKLLNEGDVKVELEKYYAYGYEEWEETLVGEYTLIIKGETITAWKHTLIIRIYDPVRFDTNVESDEEWDPESARKRDRVESVLNELGVEAPKLEDPEPPDHPERKKDGDFAVLYEWMMGTCKLVEYATLPDAKSAAELSGVIFERDGDEDSVNIRIMRRKTPEEMEEIQEHGELAEYAMEWVPVEGQD